ncbi:hypothetical protein DV735_g2461, partial [Chaetothyriales sp. CBS 134920]
MVLLTSSAVSGIIFAAVVSVFTFLLFLSGYILQQQTVRSLQESLRRPPEPKPVPTLPAAFANLEAEADEDISNLLESTVGRFDGDERRIQPDTVVVISGGSANDIPDGQGTGFSVDSVQPERTAQHQDQVRQNLAYILSVPDPLDICSVLLFAKKQRQQSHLRTKPTIMVLYPTTWESSAVSAHISALTLMRDLQEELSLTYHPVTISSGWSRPSLTSQLLGELQRLRWDYDRALYLRSPGLAVDIDSIDRALASSSIKKSWSRLAASAGHDPEMLLYARSKGLMMARGDMRGLTASVDVSDSNRQQMDDQGSDAAAYVLFDNEQLEHALADADRDHDGLDSTSSTLADRFINERRHICGGRGLLPGEADRAELRKAR